MAERESIDEGVRGGPSQPDNRSYMLRSRAQANEVLQQLGRIHKRRSKSSRREARASAKQMFGVVADIMCASESNSWNGWCKFMDRDEDGWESLRTCLSVALSLAEVESDAAGQQLNNWCVYMYRATHPNALMVVFICGGFLGTQKCRNHLLHETRGFCCAADMQIHA